MTGPLKALARKLDLKKHASKVQTGLLKLKDIHSAVIFLEGNDVETSQMVTELREIFSKKNIALDIYAATLDRNQHIGEGGIDAAFIHRRHVKWYGRIRRNKRTPVINSDSDMFISLIAQPLYPVEREALCSNARIKIGRHSPEVYDIVVEDAPEKVSSQREAFDSMYAILQKIV